MTRITAAVLTAWLAACDGDEPTAPPVERPPTDPTTLEDGDQDDDGVDDDADCDDADPAIPGDEIGGDGIDNDCDGLADCLDPDLPAGAERIWEGDATGADVLAICTSEVNTCLELTVTGHVVLTRNPARLTCLVEVAGDLTIGEEPPPSSDLRATAITSLAGLERLRRVGGTLTVHYNQLASLEGLDGLRAVGGLVVDSNGLATLDGLGSLVTVGAGVFVQEYDLVSLDGLRRVPAVPGDLTLYTGALDTLDGLESLEEVGGNFALSTTEVHSIDGLSSLRSVGGRLELAGIHARDLAPLGGWPDTSTRCGSSTARGSRPSPGSRACRRSGSSGS